jgi:septal ring factor EnvC (AmiA/AmiB activator)
MSDDGEMRYLLGQFQAVAQSLGPEQKRICLDVHELLAVTNAGYQKICAVNDAMQAQQKELLAEIKRLRDEAIEHKGKAELADSQATDLFRKCAELRNQLAKLRTALQPFAEIAEAYEKADAKRTEQWAGEGRTYPPRPGSWREGVTP